MSEKTGEIARETDTYCCENCNNHVKLSRGELVPKCRVCGGETFDISNPRFEKRDGSLAPHEPEADGT